MKLENLRTIRAIESFLRSIYLWNTTISLFVVLSILWKKIITLDIDQRAAAVSFNLILAVFPGIIFLFTLIPFVPIENLDLQIMAYLQNLLPRGIYATASATIHDIVSKKRTDILSFGFLFTAYAATNGTMSLMRAFNMALHTRERTSFLKDRWRALFLTILLVGVLIGAILIVIVGNMITTYLHEHNILGVSESSISFQTIQYVSIFSIFFIGIAIIYHFGPSIKRRLPFINVGAVIAAILAIVVTNLFSYYLENFATYNKLYGSIGTLIGLMVWIYLIALILILGFDINISVRDALAASEAAHQAEQEGNTLL